MQFALTEALIDEILFAMEDQSGKFLLDTEQGMLVSMGTGQSDDEAADEPEHCLPLPEWGPSEGFRLMERFTSALRSPLVREELSAALDRGRGVFRAFKDAVSQYPETEKFWFGFKERAMKRVIIRWYNALREQWGLELIGEEPEDTAGLVLEDFRFRAGVPPDREAALKLHQRCLESYRGGAYAGGEQEGSAARDLIAETFAAMNRWEFPGDCCLVAETAGGEFAAYIAAVYSGPSCLHIHALEVSPEYQGLGLGESLLDRLLETADSLGVPRASVDLPAGTEHFERALLRGSFKPCVQRYCRHRDKP
jgi:GNAT superfamily N-acetyltransferase